MFPLWTASIELKHRFLRFAAGAIVTTLCINPKCSDPENADDRDRCQACGSRLLLGKRFRPVAELGRGGFGRTLLAWDEAEQPFQKCVIKQILRSRGSRELDLAEAKRLVDLGRHPQIPQLIAILEATRDICLVQTYVAGRNLEQVLQAAGGFDEKQVRSLLLNLLPVLQFIHRQGIIHRDIKPENILLPEDESLPMLVDFGAARTAPTATELERTGTIIGSAGYAAPEQALGKAVPASDLYSLGITCLHLLTGEYPFDLYSVAEDRWVWRDFVATPVGNALSRVLDRLVTRSLRSRYATAEAVLADLDPAGLGASLPLMSGSPSTPLPVWRCRRVWPTSGRIANAIALSPDGRAIATANSDHSVQLWDYATGEMLHTFAQRLGFGEGHTDAVTAVAFHPSGRLLFSAGQDGRVKQWDLTRYRLQQTLQQPGWQITAIALTPDGTTLATADVEGRIAVWDVDSGQRRLDLRRHAGRVNDLALTPDGTRLASVGEAGTLRLWLLATGQLLHTWTAQAPLRSIVVSATAPALITGDKRGHVTVWSLTDFAESTDLEPHQDAVSAIALSPQENWLVSGSRDRELFLWQWPAVNPQRVAVLRHDWAVRDLTFTPDGNTLISTAADETIRFWQAGT